MCCISRNDEELSKLLSHVIISEGGVIPNIHPNLLPTKSKKGKNDDTSVCIPYYRRFYFPMLIVVCLPAGGVVPFGLVPQTIQCPAIFVLHSCHLVTPQIWLLYRY